MSLKTFSQIALALSLFYFGYSVTKAGTAQMAKPQENLYKQYKKKMNSSETLLQKYQDKMNK